MPGARPRTNKYEWNEPDPERVYANHRDRLLTVYQAERQAAHGGRDIHFFNRGYVPLFAARFPSLDSAWADLEKWHIAGRPQWEGWFTRDLTNSLDQRWQVTMDVLRYVKDHATTILPTWKGARDLATSS